MRKTSIRKTRIDAAARRVLSGHGSWHKALAGGGGGRFKTLTAAVTVVAATSLGLISAPGQAALAEPAAPPSGCERGGTSVMVVIRNDTNEPIHLIRAEHGLTNTWCMRPKADIPARSSADYLVADNIFSSVSRVLYSFPRDAYSVHFLADTTFPFGGLFADCSVKGKQPRPRCEFTRLGSPVVGRVAVRFTVLPAA